LDNHDQYPSPYGLEGHTGGKVIAGACWNFRSSINKAEADKLIFQALNILAAWPRPYTFSTPGTSNFLDALTMAAWGDYEQKIKTAFEGHNLWPAGGVADTSQLVLPKVTSCSIPNNQRLTGSPQEIVIRFNTDMDEANFNAKCKLEREDWKGRRPVELLFSFNPAEKSVTLKPAAGSEWLTPQGMQTNFTLRLTGTPPQPLTDTKGTILDGDGDGRPGGDYVVKFWVID
jgi:hypothetical protein